MAGTAQDKLYGMAEGLWEPDLVSDGPRHLHIRSRAPQHIPSKAEADVQEPEDLFETISQVLLNAVDRDALSGWGAVVHIM